MGPRFTDILNVPSSHEVLLLQGGATHQFSMVPLNFAYNNNADYVFIRLVVKKAIAEASKLTKGNILFAS